MVGFTVGRPVEQWKRCARRGKPHKWHGDSKLVEWRWAPRVQGVGCKDREFVIDKRMLREELQFKIVLNRGVVEWPKPYCWIRFPAALKAFGWGDGGLVWFLFVEGHIETTCATCRKSHGFLVSPPPVNQRVITPARGLVITGNYW